MNEAPISVVGPEEEGPICGKHASTPCAPTRVIWQQWTTRLPRLVQRRRHDETVCTANPLLILELEEVGAGSEASQVRVDCVRRREHVRRARKGAAAVDASVARHILLNTEVFCRRFYALQRPFQSTHSCRLLGHLLAPPGGEACKAGQLTAGGRLGGLNLVRVNGL